MPLLRFISKKFLNNFPLVLFISFSIFYIFLSLMKLHVFQANALDLGIFDQALYNTIHGRFLYSSLVGFSILGEHFQPIILCMLPLYLIGGGAKVLIIVQGLAVMSGIFPLYLISKKKINNESIVKLILIVYCFYIPLRHSILADFHPITLAIPLILFSFYFLEEKKYQWFIFFSVLASFCSEVVLILYAFLGVFLFFFRKQRKLGFIVFLISIVSFVVVMKYVLPSFRTGESHILHRYLYLGRGLKNIIINIFLKPQLVIKNVFTMNKIFYLFLILFPVAFLPLLNISYFFLVIPGLAINLLSTYGLMTSLIAHYQAKVIPFLFIAFVFGIKKIEGRESILNKIKIILYIGIIISILELFLGYFIRYTYQTDRIARGHDLIKSLPKNEKFVYAVSMGLFNCFSHRPNIYLFADKYQGADCVFIEEIDSNWPLEEVDYKKRFKDYLRQKRYKILLKHIFLGERSAFFPSKKEYFFKTRQLLNDKNYKVVYRENGFLVMEKIMSP